MDAREFKSAEGSCIISEDVVASIVATAALETEGVAALVVPRISAALFPVTTLPVPFG